MTHARVLGLAKVPDDKTGAVHNLVDLVLAALPRLEHLMGGSGLDHKVAELRADHFLLGNDLEEVHGGVHPALDSPSCLGVSRYSCVLLNACKVASEKSAINLRLVGGVRLGTLIGRGAVLADNQ